MLSATTANFDNYILTGDVASIAVCYVIIILLVTSYISRTRSFRIFMTIVIQLIVASSLNIAYHQMMVWATPDIYWLVYAMRVAYYILLFDVFFLFSLYATVASNMPKKKARIVAIVSSTLFSVIVIADIIRAILGYGYTVTENGMEIKQTNLYMIGYVLFVILIFVLMLGIRKLLYKRVMIGFCATMILSVIVRSLLAILNQSSLTTLTFVLPVFAMLYIMHSNPYNVALGSVDTRAMEDTVKNLYEKKEQFFFMSMLLPEFNEGVGRFPDDLRDTIKRVFSTYFKKGIMIQLSNGHLIVIVSKRKNPDYEQLIENSMKDFYKQYERFHYSYKLIIGESADEISRKNEYAHLIMSIQRNMRENTVHRITRKDIADFNRVEYITHELADIYNKHDLDDERVLAFCQPVFNLNTGKFDTAEALMRMMLPETDIIYPDEFIPIAESNGYIHVLTEIILHKTCAKIRTLKEQGYDIERISVNISVIELKDGNFCSDIKQIISGNSINGSEIALEITESRSEADFALIKEKVEELKELGIKFYLDDFGIGYSNIERIIQLPFDIIKFDKAMVTASRSDERSRRLIENLAGMFKGMGYAVLYEGVENDSDEELCRKMPSSYLQGYKYSRPVPMEQLSGFLSKK